MRKWVWFLMIVILAQAVPAYADSSDQLMSMVQSLKEQMSKMQQTIDAQNMRLQQLESQKVLEAPQANVAMQPSGTTPSATMSDADFQKSLKDNIGEAIPWMKGAKYGGDFRLRYEAFDYYSKNNDEGSTGTSADRTRNRFRIRLRWGFEKDFGDDWKMGFRLASSGNNNTDPNSTNATLGNPGYFVYKPIWIDRAYATYEPNGLKDYGPLKGAKITAGKFDNPFLRYSTTIVWDADVTPEGIYEQANLSLVSTENDKLNFQTTLGQFIVNENAAVDTDANIFAYQGALNWSTYLFNTDQPVSLSGAVSYYDYTNWYRTVTNNTAATNYLRTNSITADDFRVLDVYPELVVYVNKLPVTLWYDYAVNTANGGTGRDALQPFSNEAANDDTAWGLGFKIGKAKVKGSWELFYGYYEIGANAVVAAFNDSDFGGPDTNGFTNRQGHKFGVGYQLTDNLVVNWTGYVVSPLSPYNTGSATYGLQNARNEDVFRSQLDLVYKF